MRRLSTRELIGRIGEAVITRFREGAIEFLVAPHDPATLRLAVRFATQGDHQDDLARLGEIAAAAGVGVARGWATADCAAIEIAVQPQAAAEPLDRVVPFSAAGRRPRLASGA
jgi:hypothetical protein